MRNGPKLANNGTAMTEQATQRGPTLGQWLAGLVIAFFVIPLCVTTVWGYVQSRRYLTEDRIVERTRCAERTDVVRSRAGRHGHDRGDGRFRGGRPRPGPQRQLRRDRAHAAAPHAAVLVVHEAAAMDMLLELIDLEGRGVLGKPVDVGELTEKVKRALRMRAVIDRPA